MKIISDSRKQQAEVKNPVGFTSAELLRILGLRVTAGKNYEEVQEWGKRMTLTGIISEGVVYFAGKRTWASDTFHVFERFVSVGKEMPDGSVADRNYLWLSAWQLENINHNHLLPIDFETYRKLKSHIAKALVPLLQIWLYASRATGCFEKRYEDLCQILNLQQYVQLSRIKKKLAPALDELQAHGYLDHWQLEETVQRNDYKIIFHHGEKFHRDRADLLKMDCWKRIFSVHRSSSDRAVERQLKAELAGQIGLLSLAEFQKKRSLSVEVSTNSQQTATSLSIPESAVPDKCPS